MFGRGGVGRASSGGIGPGLGGGPVAIPRGERLKLKRIGPTDGSKSPPVALAPRPPVQAIRPSYATQIGGSPSTTTTVAHQRQATSGATTATTAAKPTTTTNSPQQPQPTVASNRPTKKRSQSTPSPSRRRSSTSRKAATTADAAAAAENDRVAKPARVIHGGVLDRMELKKGEALTYGQSLEYASGMMLGKNVLEKVLREYEYLEEDILIEAPRMLSTYARGRLIFIQGPDGTPCPTWISRVTNADALRVEEWTDGDRCLSYVNQEYIDWWKRRVQLFDPGCEMLKITTRQGELLGLVYLERNIVDDTDDLRNQTGDPRRVTLIRGIRVNPEYNQEAFRRSRLSVVVDEEDEKEMKFRGLSHALFVHVLFLSLSYGTAAVFVNAPKNDVAETFYESYMGPARLIDPETGRKQYQMHCGRRWDVLAHAFRRQLDMLVKFKEFESEKELRKEEYKAQLRSWRKGGSLITRQSLGSLSKKRRTPNEVPEEEAKRGEEPENGKVHEKGEEEEEEGYPNGTMRAEHDDEHDAAAAGASKSYEDEEMEEEEVEEEEEEEEEEEVEEEEEEPEAEAEEGYTGKSNVDEDYVDSENDNERPPAETTPSQDNPGLNSASRVPHQNGTMATDGAPVPQETSSLELPDVTVSLTSPRTTHGSGGGKAGRRSDNKKGENDGGVKRPKLE